MGNTKDIPQPVIDDMREKQIDVGLTTHILDKINSGAYDEQKPVEVEKIPEVDGERVVDATGDMSIELDEETTRARLSDLLGSRGNPEDFGSWNGSRVHFSRDELKELGIFLYPRTAYGVLNGGSATSYADEKKNASLSEEILGLLRGDFETLAEKSRGRAKGLTPAFINPDGSLGPSFLQLKMRGLLLAWNDYLKRADRGVPPDGIPFFQMTSIYNNEDVLAEYDEYKKTKPLRRLIDETGVDVTRALTGIQPLQAAYTHSDEGRPKGIFTDAFGKEHNTLPLPGGHGQNFAVLAEEYRRLYASGRRFVYLSNVDNLGATIDPALLAYFALSGRQAAFDFSFRTPVDVKGGILVEQPDGSLTAGDIGPAVSKEDVFAAEEQGKGILFNCATGLFDLAYLVPNLERISRDLPMRISDQNKDAGKYSQAEQVTWEVIGMLDEPLIFGVDKYQRFLAAKMLVETLMTSGRKLEEYPTSDDPASDFRSMGRRLHEGLRRNLQGYYGMIEKDGAWIPREVL
jgi:UDP-N-acetylglucosamine pyrophosphorylase